MAFAQINGYRMHYDVFGNDDAPALALIHGGLGGGDGSRDTINRQADSLSAEYRCVFYDRRACGESQTTADGYDMANCARDLRELLGHLGITKAHILGSSAGGPIAMQFALDYPQLTECGAGALPLTFLQNKVPKIWQETLQPVAWHQDPAKEWCPPGHGDIYLTLHMSSMLRRMLALGYEYMFVSNADNLGATVDTDILGYVSARKLPFLMEVTARTAADRKGGHLAQSPDGRLLLREIAQCPPEEIAQFQDIDRYRLFNTNNLWIHLPSLRELLQERDGFLDLPMIVNNKPVDPSRPDSPPVFQLETAVGLAISAFEGAQAIQVPRDRFMPVKRCNDLLALRSDAYRLSQEQCIGLDPRRGTDPYPAGAPLVELDDRFYQFIEQIQERFPHGPPSLLRCRSFSVAGPYTFGASVTVEGDVCLSNKSDTPVDIPDGAILSG